MNEMSSQRHYLSVVLYYFSIQLTFHLFFPKHSASGHLFADDVQAYVHGPPSQLLLASKIEDLSHELHLWMSSNRLSLNSFIKLL